MHGLLNKHICVVLMVSKGLESSLGSSQSYRIPCHVICPVNWFSKPYFCFVFEMRNRCLCLGCRLQLKHRLSVSPLPSLLFKGQGGVLARLESCPWAPPLSCLQQRAAPLAAGLLREERALGDGRERLLRNGSFGASLHGLEPVPLLSCLWGPCLAAEGVRVTEKRAA